VRAPLMCGSSARYRCSADRGNRVTVRRSKRSLESQLCGTVRLFTFRRLVAAEVICGNRRPLRPLLGFALPTRRQLSAETESTEFCLRAMPAHVPPNKQSQLLDRPTMRSSIPLAGGLISPGGNLKRPRPLSRCPYRLLRPKAMWPPFAESTLQE
jgi:hypothetical protein